MKISPHVLACLAALTAPARAEPAATPDPCSHRGPGFVAVPGTATCVKVSGTAVAGANAGRRATRTRTGGSVAVDVRTDTEAGPLRGFVRLKTSEGSPRQR